MGLANPRDARGRGGKVPLEKMGDLEELKVGLQAILLDAFNVKPNGLGLVSEDPDGGMGPAFANAIVWTGLFPTGGLLYKFGQTLWHYEYDYRKQLPKDWSLAIYEVSYCDQARPVRCKPPDPKTEYLEFYLSSGTQFYGGVVVPYDADAWSNVEPGFTNWPNG